MMVKRCRKCGDAMQHPRWDAAADVLVHRCQCGYCERTLPDDATPATEAVKKLLALQEGTR